MFISFEGGEAAGKTTQIKALARYLEGLGHDIIVTREPGGTPNAEAIRDLLMNGDADKWSGMTELLLMYAARKDHVERVIQPALDAGKVVITDRFADSSMAYQGYVRGTGRKAVKAVHKVVLGKLWPDITFLFDIDPAIAAQRMNTRTGKRTRFDDEALEFHYKIRNAFLKIAKKNPDRCKIIDATMNQGAVQKQVQTVLQNWMKTRNA